MNSKIAVHTQHFLEVKQSTENEMRVSGQALDKGIDALDAAAGAVFHKTHALEIPFLDRIADVRAID